MQEACTKHQIFRDEYSMAAIVAVRL